jgi:hypothetical protein
MHASPLSNFINFQSVQFPGAREQLFEFVARFKQSLPARTRDDYTRGRIVAELAQLGFQIGIDRKVFWVAGIAPRGHYESVNGRMTLQRART